MKTLISLLFVMACCSAERTIAPNYTSIEGSWKFISASTSGNFVIQEGKDGLYVVSGEFEILTNHYTITTPTKITDTYISLLGTESSQLALLKPVINQDNTEIICFKIEYDSDTRPTTSRTETVLITRV